MLKEKRISAFAAADIALSTKRNSSSKGIAFQELFNDLDVGYTIRLSVEVGDDSMTQYWPSHRPDVVDIRRVSTFEDCPCLRAKGQVLRGPGASAPAEPICNELRCCGRPWAA